MNSRKFFAISMLGAVLTAGTMTGCVNSSKHTTSVDDQWIQQQQRSGQEVPAELQK